MALQMAHIVLAVISDHCEELSCSPSPVNIPLLLRNNNNSNSNNNNKHDYQLR